VAQLNENENLIVETDLSPPATRLSRNVAGTIFSIIQEAVNNIKRHAQASHIKITVSADAQNMLVQVKDNGVGFDVAKIQDEYEHRGSFGLLNMKERTELISGVLTIDSKIKGVGRGTTVTLSVPLTLKSGSLNHSLLSK